MINLLLLVKLTTPAANKQSQSCGSAGEIAPKLATLDLTQRNAAIKQLQNRPSQISPSCQQKKSFIPAALNVSYLSNRDYLLAVLQSCAQTASDCDEDTGYYVTELYKRGQAELL